MGNIIEYVKPEKHTLYMSCAQYADWIPRNFDENVEEAYIVQEVVLEQIIDEIKSVVHYFEAWKIENGICKKEYLQDSDDLFCIGHPLDDGDALRDSIGHERSVIFRQKCFW